MKHLIQTWLPRIHKFVALVYGPRRVHWPKTKQPPTGIVFDLVVVTLLFVFGIGSLFV